MDSHWQDFRRTFSHPCRQVNQMQDNWVSVQFEARTAAGVPLDPLIAIFFIGHKWSFSRDML